MKLVVVIPAFNEEKTIAQVISGIPSTIPGVSKVRVMVVDDGSKDRTRELAEQAGATVVRHPENRGVGAAFVTGIKSALAAGADCIVNIDADGQFNPNDISKLIEPVVRGEADFVTATRFGDKSLIPKMPLVKKYGNFMVRGIINYLTGGNFTDVSCGFRAYTRETALKLNLFGSFTYTQETFINLVQKGIRIKEVPLKVRGEREFGKSRVAGSVLRYGLKSGSIILLAMRDIKPMSFFGWIGFSVTLLGMAVIGFVFVHWLKTNMTTPYQSLILVGAVILIVGFLLIVMALLADMLGRMRKTQEEILLILRDQYYRRLEKEDKSEAAQD
jgi:glycosyltransferase involved in cell wall biosynthesis